MDAMTRPGPGSGRDVDGMRLTARGRRVVVTAAVLLAATAGFVGGRADAATAVVDQPVREIAVAPGDTLWAIAGRVAQPGEDRRDAVRRIQDLNGMTSAALVAGSVITVPVP